MTRAGCQCEDMTAASPTIVVQFFAKVSGVDTSTGVPSHSLLGLENNSNSLAYSNRRISIRRRQSVLAAISEVGESHLSVVGRLRPGGATVLSSPQVASSCSCVRLHSTSSNLQLSK